MSFYGSNINNVNKTQFSFDKIYPNRKQMEVGAKEGDGVYLGRFVLVEYDIDNGKENAEDFPTADINKKDSDVVETWTFRNEGTTEKPETIFKCIAPADSTKPFTDKEKSIIEDDTNNNFILINSIVCAKNVAGNKYNFYRCTGYKGEGINISGEKIGIGFNKNCIYGEAKFTVLTYNSNNSFTTNYAIDEVTYGYSNGLTEDKGIGRGYDSTVWQKTYVNGSEKYVMIAELNSVVPSFSLVEDAPTMTPVAPHFDAASNNVNYRLHVQPSWGFRVGRINDNFKSLNTDGNYDGVTRWITSQYSPQSDDILYWWYDPDKENEYNEDSHWFSTTTPGDIESTLPADIFFNKRAFDPQVDPLNLDPSKINKKAGTIDRKATENSEETIYKNEITVEPTGVSGENPEIGARYNLHNSGQKPEMAEDIQELRISLPAIGNMMSDAWDIIHGPCRNDSPADSLKGRLEFFRQNLNVNEIPIQSQESEDGPSYLIGSRINNNENYDFQSRNILDVSPNEFNTANDGTEKEDSDDPWIQTTVNTIFKKPVYDEASGQWKQDSQSAISIRHTFKSAGDSTKTSVNKNNGDFKTANIAGKEPVVNNQGNDDLLHFYTPYVDQTGHVVSHNEEIVTLPYGFKFIETNGVNNSEEELETNTSQIQANNSKDTWKINSGNEWIRLNNDDSTNTTIIGHSLINKDNNNEQATPHQYYGQSQNLSINDLDTNNAFIIPRFKFDNAGHIIAAEDHTVQLPENFTTIEVIGNNTDKNDSLAGTSAVIDADTLTSTLKLEAQNQWIQMFPVEDNESGGTIGFKHYVNNEYLTDNTKEDSIDFNEVDSELKRVNQTFKSIESIITDEAGHIIGSNTREYNMPNSFKTIHVSNSDNTDDKTVNVSDNADAIVRADNLITDLQFGSGNKWIIADYYNENTKAITLSHYTKAFEDAPDVINLNNEGDTFTVVNKAEWDNAGHLTSYNSRTYTLPYGYKTINISNNGSGNVGFAAAAGNQIVAASSKDSYTLNAANRWLKLGTSASGNDIIDIIHTAPGATKTTIIKSAQTPLFGETFNIPKVQYDEAGHISAEDTVTVTIPKPSHSNTDNQGNERVYTGFSFTDTTGAIATTSNTIGNMLLTGYNKASALESVVNTDNLNAALGKLEYKLDNTKSTLDSFLKDADFSENAKDQLLEIQQYMTDDTAAFEQLSAKVTKEISDREADVNAEESRAKGVEDSLNQAVVAETQTARAAESDLSDRINAEAQTARAAEEANANAISSLTTGQVKTNADNITILQEDVQGLDDGLQELDDKLTTGYVTKTELANSGYVKNTDQLNSLNYDDTVTLKNIIETLQEEIRNMKIIINGLHPSPPAESIPFPEVIDSTTPVEPGEGTDTTE